MAPFKEWLPRGKKAAVCFTIDDLHPGKSTDPYEAGGDLGRGALRHVEWLLKYHPSLHITLFVTADWREIGYTPTRLLLSRIPWLRDRVYLTPIQPPGTMRLGRHPEFVTYLKSLPRTDCALHGLYHVNKGLRIPEEYSGKSRKECKRRLTEIMRIFREAGLPYSSGLCPPAWGLSDDLAEAMIEVGLGFVASARDLRTPITPDAMNSMSGRSGVSILYPQWIMGNRLLHLPTNFQATSEIQRAHEIVECNGLVSCKAHITVGMVDQLNETYRDYLHRCFTELEDRYGNDLWWTSMAEITAVCDRDKTGAAVAPGD